MKRTHLISHLIARHNKLMAAANRHCDAGNIEASAKAERLAVQVMFRLDGLLGGDRYYLES